MRLKTLVYFSLLGVSSSLFALAALLTPHVEGDIGGLGLVRFVARCLGAGCAVATWGTAVTIVSIHKKTWPLYITVGAVVLASLSLTMGYRVR